MLVYKDLFLDDDVCSDAFPVTFEYGGEVLCFKGKLTKKTESGDYNIGGNPSQEEQAEDFECDVQSGIDICLNHNLEDATTEMPKSRFKKYIGKFCKKVKCKIHDEGREDDEVQFQNTAKQFVSDILADFDSFQFFRTKLDVIDVEDPEDLYYIPVKYNEEENNYSFYLLKKALKEEKY